MTFVQLIILKCVQIFQALKKKNVIQAKGLFYQVEDCGLRTYKLICLFTSFTLIAQPSSTLLFFAPTHHVLRQNANLLSSGSAAVGLFLCVAVSWTDEKTTCHPLAL